MDIRVSRRQAGFTLIEVLAALSILALTVASLSQVRSLAHQHITISKQLQLASFYADSHLNRLSVSKNLRAGFQTGEYRLSENSATFPWELELQELDSSSLEPHSKQLTNKVTPLIARLTVRLADGERKLEFETLILASPVFASAANARAKEIQADASSNKRLAK